MNEVWKNWGEFYEVSNLGRCARKEKACFTKTKRCPNGYEVHLQRKVMQGTITSHGYRQVAVLIDGKRCSRYLHRLIAEAFLPNPENKPVINHKNGNKLDNRVENIEWATVRENVIHARDFLGVWPDSSVAVIRLDTGTIYPSVTVAAESLGMAKGNLSSHLKGKQMSFAGTQWKYFNAG